MADPDTQEQEEKLGFAHENLEGYVPSLATSERDSRSLRQGLRLPWRSDDHSERPATTWKATVFDRRAESADLSQCVVRMFPKNSAEKMSIRYSDIAALAFTGKDGCRQELRGLGKEVQREESRRRKKHRHRSRTRSTKSSCESHSEKSLS